MIFVTVGHQMPFDRLIRAVDEWAAKMNRDDVFAQIGNSSFIPSHMPYTKFLSPREFDAKLDAAAAIIAHAGTGTILAAVQRGKPLLVLSRQSSLGETRNDHQIPTAQRFAENGYVLAASDETDLTHKIQELSAFRPRCTISQHASPKLLEALSRFAFGDSA